MSGVINQTRLKEKTPNIYIYIYIYIYIVKRCVFLLLMFYMYASMKYESISVNRYAHTQDPFPPPKKMHQPSTYHTRPKIAWRVECWLMMYENRLMIRCHKRNDIHLSLQENPDGEKRKKKASMGKIWRRLKLVSEELWNELRR